MIDVDKKRLTYDVGCVLSPSGYVLTNTHRTSLSKALRPHTITDEFISLFQRSVDIFVQHRLIVSESTPKKTHDRINNVHSCAKNLFEALSKLSENDARLIDEHFTMQFLSGNECISINQFSENLLTFLASTNHALAVVDESERRGRMPGFAEQSLAQDICYMLNTYGITPTTTPSGIFSGVLKLALSIGDKLCKSEEEEGRLDRDRKDVAALMSFAIKRQSSD